MSPEQCREARERLNWTRHELAVAAEVPLWFIASFEEGTETAAFLAHYELAIRQALEDVGIGFPYVLENGEARAGPRDAFAARARTRQISAPQTSEARADHMPRTRSKRVTASDEREPRPKRETSPARRVGTVEPGTTAVRSTRVVRLSVTNGCNGCAPCQGGAFQWVKVPPGNRSSRKQPEQAGGDEMSEALDRRHDIR